MPGQLFNASAVIESRAATKLDENVKLLTYVSVAYLPLSLCAALWAIDYSYHPAVFTTACVLLATATYVIVLNLNNITRAGKLAYYTGLRSGVIDSMLGDDKWAPTARAFDQFRPQRQDSRTPSEWYIVVLLLSIVGKWLAALRLRLRAPAIWRKTPKPQADV
ncbi:hypothetical protein BJY01DRAFT_251061 [Aspergillus pseudoustus]|uniref:Uncharacterized protein n=1 Tax=Aspergillus pseudoustus TaxID=1810923 RepID=A0ABR4JE01_9EURO